MAEASFVKVADGHSLFVRDWGAGPPVLLMAGWAMTSDLWGEVMLALNERGLRTIAYDRRGHGRSSDPGGVDFDLLADDLRHVIEDLGLSGLTVVAHSGAAGEVVRYVTRFGSARIARLILVGASGPCLMWRRDNPDGLPAEAIGELQRRICEDLTGWIDENAAPFAPGASRRTLDWLAAMVLGCSRRIIADFQTEIAETDWRADCAALPMPVTIIHGDQDASAPIDLTARKIEALVEGAEFVLYENGAHGLMVTHGARLAADIADRVRP